MSEETILQRIAAGEAKAVNECVDRYGGLLWSLARRFLRNEADAEDAVQDIFIAIWSSADRYKPEISAEVTFISTIARRRLIDRLRQAGRRPAVQEFDEQNASLEMGTYDSRSKNQLEESAELEQVGRVLDEMPAEHREILSMSLYEGYSHSEIASELNIPLGTVKTRVRRGLIHIREQLEIGDEPVVESTN